MKIMQTIGKIQLKFLGNLMKKRRLGEFNTHAIYREQKKQDVTVHKVTGEFDQMDKRKRTKSGSKDAIVTQGNKR